MAADRVGAVGDALFARAEQQRRRIDCASRQDDELRADPDALAADCRFDARDAFAVGLQQQPPDPGVLTQLDIRVAQRLVDAAGLSASILPVPVSGKRVPRRFGAR